MSEYYSDDVARLSNTFQVDDVDTDPSTVTCRVESPAGTVTAYAYGASPIVKDAVGHYHIDLGPFGAADAGLWTYRWVGTGVCACSSGPAQAFRVTVTGP